MPKSDGGDEICRSMDKIGRSKSDGAGCTGWIKYFQVKATGNAPGIEERD